MHSDMDTFEELCDPKLQYVALQEYRGLSAGMSTTLDIEEGFQIFHLRPVEDYEFGDEVGFEMLPGDLRGCVGQLVEITEVRCLDKDRHVPMEFFGIDTAGDFHFFDAFIAEWEHNGKSYTIPVDLLAPSGKENILPENLVQLNFQDLFMSDSS